MHNLPNELLIQVALFLSVSDLLVISFSQKRWKGVAQQVLEWRKFSIKWRQAVRRNRKRGPIFQTSTNALWALDKPPYLWQGPNEKIRVPWYWQAINETKMKNILLLRGGDIMCSVFVVGEGITKLTLMVANLPSVIAKTYHLKVKYAMMDLNLCLPLTALNYSEVTLDVSADSISKFYVKFGYLGNRDRFNLACDKTTFTTSLGQRLTFHNGFNCGTTYC